MIEELCTARGRPQRVREILKKGGSDLEIFRSLASEFLTRNARDRELTRLLWFTALENHELSLRFFNTFVAEYYNALAEHIRVRIEQGAFRRTDPLLAARGFLGMVVYHFLIQELFGGEEYQTFDPEQVADTLSHIWLAGIENPARTSTNGHNGRPSRVEKLIKQ
jgi:AcrR family transcriptional regulator